MTNDRNFEILRYNIIILCNIITNYWKFNNTDIN